MTTAPVASSTFDTSRVHSLTRPNMVSVGTIIWLSSELMFFAGLFAMYFTARARATEGWPPEPTELNIPYAVVFTLILIASSVTCQFGVFAAEQGNVYGLRRWFTITFVMGLAFVLGQAKPSSSARRTSTASSSPSTARRSRRRPTARSST
ncbi:cytochrome c oxidase subunit 3 [Blastococcus sp. CT_GayMR16]|uniref:cytochrome c oxidase subunit 3 n=1 Tax=Blastococcus sp. CT_GayMR16 TaxID=2559607 RepID=UPI002474ACAF|nr:cytochrome c oxidase subunit 3 [Blastococcus sp. CT_GayMR16]